MHDSRSAFGDKGETIQTLRVAIASQGVHQIRATTGVFGRFGLETQGTNSTARASLHLFFRPLVLRGERT